MYLFGIMLIGDVLNIDPMKFYTHLYKTLFSLHAGNTRFLFSVFT